MKVLVTGAKGFVGRNLVVMLGKQSDVKIIGYDLDDPQSLLDEGLATADVIFHLAGVNRPEKPEDFAAGNAGFTQSICSRLSELHRKPAIILSSSIQAALDNPYGVSKREAEEALIEFAGQTGATGCHLSYEKCFRQVVSPELQFCCGYVLQQHRPGSPDHYL